MLQSFTLHHGVAFILGCVIGSFANVCIHRLPWQHSLMLPPSHCPNCQQGLRPWHNVPIVSYVLLKGRCAYCHTAISWRYPFVEFLCGLLYIVLYAHFGFSIPGMIFTLLATSLLIVSFIDLAYRIIPDVITLPGIIAGLLASTLATPIGLGSALLGAVIGGGLCLLIAIVSRGGMGGGGIKLTAMSGACLGGQGVLVTIFLAALSGAVSGLFLLLIKKKGRKDALPFGPFLALGALLSLLWGHEIVHLYLRV
jgi:leader peptidase (prepilin peptidase)/N-methyltransferase